MVISVTGRRTGRQYSIPVGYQRMGNQIRVLVSKARRKNWWRNLQTPTVVTLRVRGRKLCGTAHVVSPTAPEFRETIRTTLTRLPSLGHQFGIEYDPDAEIDEKQWAVLGEANVLVAIDLDSDR